MKYKIFLSLVFVCPWLRGGFEDIHSYVNAKQIIENKTKRPILVTVNQEICRKRTWVIMPNEKKEISLRTRCAPKNLSISSYPKIGWQMFKVGSTINQQANFPISEHEYWRVSPHQKLYNPRIHQATQWHLIIGPSDDTPGSVVPITSK